ncbi:MAG TPA: hypothetical protein VJB93_03795 [Patescibacteria group bacterium]|nr:hypothetical protein [Patescibacteria group bacterium]
MPTTKKRINISVPAHIDHILTQISRRDHIPVATKAFQLIQTALEIEEDIALETIARKRDTKHTTWVPVIDFSEINPDGVPAEKVLQALKKIEKTA